FLVPFQVNDGSISSYLLCSNNNGDFAYRYYKKNELSNLYAANDSIKQLRMGLLSVFGYFEKTINNKETTHIEGLYDKTINNVSISFDNSSLSGRVADAIFHTIRICWDGMWPARITDEMTVCYDYYVWEWTVWNMTWEDYQGGGGGGGSSFPDGYVCPNSEWWCVSGDLRYVDGLLVNPGSYPGIN